LLKDELKDDTKQRFIQIINELEHNGAKGIVLGCTEIPLLIQQKDTRLPIFNTLEIHAKAAVDYALS
jgi:aspartate racemase